MIVLFDDICRLLGTCCVVVACSRSTKPAATETTPPKASATDQRATDDSVAAQSVDEGVRALCDSGWDGNLDGPEFRPWIPDDVADAVTNEDVRELLAALASPDAQRVAMVDAYLDEVGLAELERPLREEWKARGWRVSWPLGHEP